MYSAQIKQALESVERNQGVLWGFQPHEVPLLWAELECKGYIRLNRWSNCMELTPAGRETLENDNG